MRRNSLLCLLALTTPLSACSDPETSGQVAVECEVNSECPTGQECNRLGVCVDEPPEPPCEGPSCPCQSNEQCDEGLLCDTSLQRCFEPRCSKETETDDCETNFVCREGRCVACVDPENCDDDRDGVNNIRDNCRDTVNPGQENEDGDEQGDACDPDDDNDGILDDGDESGSSDDNPCQQGQRIGCDDNCPFDSNHSQADADGDGDGNACDEDTRGTTVRGRLDFSAGGDPDTGEAQVFLIGIETPQPIDTEGNFIFEQDLPDGGVFSLKVVWPGFVNLEESFVAPTDEETFDVGVLVLRSEADDELLAVEVNGLAQLQDEDEHTNIVVRARIGVALVETTLTDDTGDFVLTLSRVDHNLSFAKENFLTEERTLIWNNQQGRFEDLDPVVLEPNRNASLAGRLVTEVEEFDFSDAVVTLVSRSRRPLPRPTPTGEFGDEGLRVGLYTLEVEVEGHRPISRLISIEPRENNLGDIVVEPIEAVLTGQVDLVGQEDDGGVLVRLTSDGELVATTLSDPDGHFVVDVLPRSYALSLSKEGFVGGNPVPVEHDGQRFVVDGQPLDEQILTLNRLPPDLSANISFRLRTPVADDFDFTGGRVALVGEEERTFALPSDGRFAQGSLAPGLYGLEIEVEGHRSISQFVNLESANNDNNDLGELLLEPERVLMQGRVVTQQDGELVAIAGAFVELQRDGQFLAALTNDEGRFFIETLPVAHSLEISAPGFLRGQAFIVFEQGRFVRGEDPLDEVPFELVREPQSDRDADGVIDVLDNCPERANPNQDNIDNDGLGDACDSDADGDGMVNGLDNCPFSPNPMQEDADGLGRGVACSLGTVERPIVVGCGVTRQRLDTREREDRLQSRCGGAGAAEVVYALGIHEGERWSVEVEAQHTVVISVIDELGHEVECVVGGSAELSGDVLGAGNYRLVVDGLQGTQSAGPVQVSIDSVQACAVTFSLTQFDTGSQPLATAVEDLDGDGDRDLITANSLGDSVSVMLGDGRGGFAAQEIFAVGDGPSSVATGDVDEDGHLDIVTANGLSDTVSILLGDGQGSFAQEQAFDTGAGPGSAVFGDMDGDGHLDIVTANQSDDSVSVLLGNGVGSFAQARSFSAGDDPRSAALGDLDGDGNLDIVVVSLETDTVVVLLGDGQGGFGSPQTFNTGDAPNSVAVGDLDGDGDLDIATANRGGFSDGLSVLLGDGQGGFAQELAFPVGEDAIEVVVGDVDGDGNMDIATANRGSRDVSVLLGDGRGGFAQAQNFGTGARAFSVSLADLDGDGLLDITTANLGNDNVSILLSAELGSYAPQLSFGVGDNPQSAALGDIDGDGDLDIAVANFTSNTVSVLRGDGQGSFALQQTFDTGSGPNAVALGDLDGDGDLDIAATNFNGNDVSVLLGNGLGGFDPQQSFAVGASPSSLILADLDGDDDLDIAATNFNGNDVSVLLGDGLGGFDPQQAFSVGDSPTSVAVGDLNGDSDLDIIAADRVSNTVSVLLGDGLGGFVQGPTFPVTDEPNTVALGDVDGDGELDIVTANLVSDDISVLRGNGQGGFAQAQSFRVGDRPSSMKLSDLDGDGTLDIVTADRDSDTVSVLLGDGRGGFSPGQVFSVLGQPFSVAVGDLDGDGELDIVTANLITDTVSFLLRRRRSRAAVSFTDSRLEPCQEDSFRFDAVRGDLLASVRPPCRICRLEFDILQVQGDVGVLTLTSALNHSQTFTPPADALIWRPEYIQGLARFERHPLGGRWSLGGELEPSNIDMVVNRFPGDPLAEGTLVEACTPDLDQAAEPSLACRLGADALEGALLEDDGDEDVYLLEGDFDGAFIRGQIIEVVLTSESGSELDVELRAFRASKALTTAAEDNGVWTLSFEVPPEYSGRYFAVHVRGRDVQGLIYDLQVNVD